MLNAKRRGFYKDSHAARYRPGKPYCPANGTEGEMFAERWCDHCEHNGGCEIYAAAFFTADPDSPDHPYQWRHGADGQPECTAFEEADQP